MHTFGGGVDRPRPVIIGAVDELGKIERLEKELSELHAALVTRSQIGEAKGILMERFALTSDQAFAILKRLSSHENVRVSDIAAELVRTRELPDHERRRTGRPPTSASA